MLRPTDLRPVSSPQGCSSKTYEKKALESEMLSRAFFALRGYQESAISARKKIFEKVLAFRLSRQYCI